MIKLLMKYTYNENINKNRNIEINLNNCNKNHEYPLLLACKKNNIKMMNLLSTPIKRV